MTSSSLNDPWSKLSGYCSSDVVNVPKTWRDPARSSMAMPPNLDGIVNYLLKHVVGQPWADHLVLYIAVLLSQNVLFKTAFNTLSQLHNGFSALFDAFGLQTMTDWDVDKHLALYLQEQVLENHTPYRRMLFWRQYIAGSRHLKRWLASLPMLQQEQYRPFVFPFPRDPHELALLSRVTFIRQEREEKRKTDTDALMPFYMDLRTQAHLRYNLLVRLCKAYRQAIQMVESGKASLPFEFEMRERGNAKLKKAPTERLVFRLWDRRTFVLNHADAFSQRIVYDAQHGIRAYIPARNSYLLEFLRAEPLDSTLPVVGLWFMELLELDVLGEHPLAGSSEEIAAKQAWLREQGYGEDETELITPFGLETSGVLLAPVTSGDGAFARHVRERTGTVFIPVESFYTAATFGMVALHILTANGMRIGELMQLRASADCIVPILVSAPPEAEDQAPQVHWEVRVIPKGHRSPKPYYFDDEHLRLLSLIKFMLCEHYGIDPQTGGDLPIVRYRGVDAHRFKPDRYLWQYNHRALRAEDLRGCMRFLVHGLVFQTLDGRRVTVRPHLLRHGFATWALNVAKEPLDIVAAILNQKNLAITKYYGRPNQRLIVERSHGLMTHISSYIDVNELVLRSPEEIRQMLREAQRTHGTLARVRGGRCLLSGECPILFACIGCSAKAPDPAQRSEVEEVHHLTLIQVNTARKKGLMLESIQLEKKLKQCEAELREMDMIELCRDDEQREPEVNFHAEA